MRRRSPETSSPRRTETFRLSNSTRLLNRLLRVSVTRRFRMGPARWIISSAMTARTNKIMTEAIAIQVQTRLPGLIVPEEDEKERVGSGLSGVTDYELTGGNSS